MYCDIQELEGLSTPCQNAPKYTDFNLKLSQDCLLIKDTPATMRVLSFTRWAWRDTIRSAVAENPMLHTQTSWFYLLYNRSYCRLKFYITGLANIALFAPITLTLSDPMTFINKYDPCLLKMYLQRKKWTFYVKSFDHITNRQTNIQTDATKTLPRLFAGSRKSVWCSRHILGGAMVAFPNLFPNSLHTWNAWCKMKMKVGLCRWKLLKSGEWNFQTIGQKYCQS